MEFLNTWTVLVSVAVVFVEQIMKWKYFPSQIANKYPVPTLLVLSAGGGAFAYSQDWINPTSVWTWVVSIATIAVISAVTYYHTLRNWEGLRKTEG